MGALTQLWAGTSPEGKDLGGKVTKMCCVAEDPLY